MSDYDPIAYTYDADYHCPGCAESRFGRDPVYGSIAITSAGVPCLDSEGNEVGAVAPWNEWWEPLEPLPQVLSCGTCLSEITTLEGETS